MSEPVHLSRRHFLQGVAAMGFAGTAPMILDGCASPASTARMPRIGVLSQASSDAVLEPFRQGLRELGRLPGENIAVEYRYTRGDLELAPALAAELVALKLDVIVTGGGPNALAAKNATTTIPIVAVIFDPVSLGLVDSLARPGGNLTGFSGGAAGLRAKALELLTRAIPTVRRVGAIGPFNFVKAIGPSPSWWKETQDAAPTLGIELVTVFTSGADDLERAFDEAIAKRVDAVLTAPDATLFSNHVRIATLALQKNLPALFDAREYVDAGGLMSYAANFVDTWRHAAVYVDRILRGAKPADLPVEQPSKFDFVINLRTAAALGLTIPPSVLAQATEVLG